MKNSIKMTFALLLTTSFSCGVMASDFPLGPELSITTGKLCDQPSGHRYPENIAYCTRDVSWETKESLMKEYDQKFNYKVLTLPRVDIKIDHMIPLCAGGSNDISNLWPQHKSVYVITDPIEPILCAKMAQGRLKQKDAVSLIIEAKTNLSRANEILQHLNRL